jgi:hypothetical protein
VFFDVIFASFHSFLQCLFSQHLLHRILFSFRTRTSHWTYLEGGILLWNKLSPENLLSDFNLIASCLNFRSLGGNIINQCIQERAPWWKCTLHIFSNEYSEFHDVADFPKEKSVYTTLITTTFFRTLWFQKKIRSKNSGKQRKFLNMKHD